LELSRFRDRRELHFERAHQVAHAETGDRRRHGAGIQPRDVEQRAENFFNGLQRIVDVADKAGILAAILALDKTCDVEARRVERLQDVVAGRCEKSSLGDIGFFGGDLGQCKLAVESGQLFGAFTDPPFERCVRALQRFRRLEARRDVGKGDDQRATRHAIGANFDNHLRSASRSR